MIMKAELVKRIKDYFGLNIYETKVWLALLSKGVASAGEISDISGVPRSRTYDVLESLEKQGFAMEKIGKPVKYLAVKPNVVIDKLKKGAMGEMEEKMSKLAGIKDTIEYKELEGLHSSKEQMIKKEDISSTVRGRLNINSQITDVLNLAQEEVIICTTVEEMKRRIKLLEPVIKRLNDSKIKLVLALKGEDSEIKILGEKLGVKPKKINVNSSFYIADRREILFMLNETDDNDSQLAVWFSSPFFVQSFTTLFDMALKQVK